MKNRFSMAKLALAATLLAASATAQAEPRSVYIAGIYNPHFGGVCWNPPVTSQLVPTYQYQQLYETADGSNVFTGTFEFLANHPFRFYTELFDDSEEGINNYIAYISNIVAPAFDTDPALGNGEKGSAYLTERGNSSVFDGTGVYSPLISYNASGWILPANRQGTYKVLLDLNDTKNVKVTLIPAYKYYVVRSDQSDPTLATIADYAPVGNPYFIGYFPADENTFGLYDLSNEQWLKPIDNFTMVYGSQGELNCNVSTSRASFTLPDWPGGILSLMGPGTPVYELLPDKPVTQPYTTTIATLIGDFSYWSFYDSPQYNFAEPVSEFDITLPAGAQFWKMVLGTTWDATNFGLKNVTKAADGSFVVALELNGNNIEFDVPLTSDLNGHVDLSKLTITFPASAPLTASGSASNDDGSYPDYVDELLVEIQGYGVTPWQGASAAVMGTVTHLIKQADGTYRNGMFLDRPFRFISSRAPQGVVYEVIAPDANGSLREVTMPEATGHSSAVTTTSAKGGWWTVPTDLLGTHVDVTVDCSGTSPKVTFYAESRKSANAIYLIGSIQGWNIGDSSCPLYLTDNGGYYGSFPIRPYDADSMQFRFYTELGTWGNDGQLPAFGASSYDMDNAEISLDDNGTYSGSGTPGKGNWTITNWSGSTLYAYVNINSLQVIFANHPIAEAGNVLSPDYKPDCMWIYDEAKGTSVKMNKVGDDLFTAAISTSDPQGYKFRLFSALPTIARDEAAWGTADAYVAASDGIAPDMLGISEIDVTAVSDITTPAPISIPLDPEANPYHYVTFDRAAGKVYFEPQYSSRIYLTGAIANGRELTYANRADWSHLSVNENGGIVYIPEGKFDFTPVNFICPGTEKATSERNVVWDTYGMMTFPVDYSAYRYDGILDYSLRCDGWTGGNVAIRKHAIADLTGLTSITANIGNSLASGSAPLTKQADGTFKGKVAYSEADASTGLYFIAKASPESSRYDFCITSTAAYTSIGDLVNEGANVLRSDAGTYSAPLAFNGLSFTLPGLLGAGELDVKLDLANMRMTAVNSGAEAPVYEAVADENSPLNGALITPSTENPDVMVMEYKTVAPTEEAPLEFNFARPDGSVLVPEGGNTTIEFGPDGIYTGSIAVASTQRTLSRSALRTAASASSKWQLSLPEGMASTDLSTVINEAEGTITIFSSAHNSDVYYISWTDNETFASSTTSLLNLNDGNSRTLVRNTDGIFTGEFVPAGESVALMFHTIPGGNSGKWGSYISLPSGVNEMTFDLTSTSEVSRQALSSSLYYTWGLKAPEGKVNIAFDPELCTLTMVHSSASVESVAAEAAGQLTLIPAEGCIRVWAPEATVIEVHNLSGALVKRVNAPAGHSSITLPAGYYTAAQTKLLVK
ncbi:MAG: hypothetical protein NC187_05405 [Candidatus Amulumruptor caecigallinarius]|nr:hypothetical protein [Candidatus Amulumruptor caecigallinarius]MCM1396907.1 hypothetical protein [Candidatus Amulumruptor caecigallinarius]MCM1454149.1 hypothetical protein [bacterium]